MATSQYQAHAQLLEAALLLDLKQPVVLLKDADTIPVAVLTVHVGPRENPLRSREFIAHNPTSMKIDLLCRQALDFLREYHWGDGSKMQHLKEPIRPSKSAWEQASKQLEHNYYTALQGFTALHIKCYDAARELERLKLKEEYDKEIQLELHKVLAEREQLRAIVASKKRYAQQLEASITARLAQLGCAPCTSLESDEDDDGSGTDTSESEMQM